jgi:hypothetical protein
MRIKISFCTPSRHINHINYQTDAMHHQHSNYQKKNEIDAPALNQNSKTAMHLNWNPVESTNVEIPTNFSIKNEKLLAHKFTKIPTTSVKIANYVIYL